MKKFFILFIVFSMVILNINAQQTVLGEDPYEWSNGKVTETISFGGGTVRVMVNYGDYIYGPIEYEAEKDVIIFSFENESGQKMIYRLTGSPEQLDVNVEKEINTTGKVENLPARKYTSVSMTAAAVEIPQIVDVPDEDEIEEEIEISFDMESEDDLDGIGLEFEEEEENEDDEVFMIVEKPATAVGGLETIYAAINDKLGELKEPVRVFVQFIVEKDGSTSEVNVVKSDDDSINSALIEVIEQSEWTPASLRGSNVRQRLVQSFSLGR